MTTPRRIKYDEGCLAAHALNVVGDRWALLVVRELLLTPKRFQAIRAGLPGISPAVLTQRLDQLAEAGIVVRHQALGYYQLTDVGYALRPVVLELARWGVRHPAHDPTRFISPTSLMLSMTIMIDGRRAGRRRDAVGFDLGTEQFAMRLDGRGGVDLQVVPQAQGDLVLAGTGNTVAWAVYGPLPLTDHLASGAVRLTGDPARAQAFIDLFCLHT